MIYLMEIDMIFYLIIVLCLKFTCKFYKLSSVVDQLNITSYDQENLQIKLRSCFYFFFLFNFGFKLLFSYLIRTSFFSGQD